jgi:hypothetical protein
MNHELANHARKPGTQRDPPSISHSSSNELKMKSSILAATMTVLAALSAAAPTAIEAESRQFQVSVTFYGENDQSYSLLVPADRTVVHIGTSFIAFPHPPSISKSSYGTDEMLTFSANRQPPHRPQSDFTRRRILYVCRCGGRECGYLRRG